MSSPDRQAPGALGWAAAALGGGLLLHLDRVAPWVSLVALACIAWRMTASMTRRAPLPGAVLRTLLALLLVAAVLARFQTLNGLTAGSALLILMGAVKLLETKTRRDEFVVVGTSLFLLLAACLDRQTMLRTPLYLAHGWVCCSTLAMIAYASSSPAPGAAAGPILFRGRDALSLAARSLLLAVPLAVVLFVFLPRMTGSLWALPRSEEAVTGLGDTMSPGSITRLTSSYEVAFRAHFTTHPPAPQERYWRGPVLDDFDGFTWRHRANIFARRQPLLYLGPAYRYQIWLEPSSHRWWFALDTPVEAPEARVFFSAEYELQTAEPVDELTSYVAVSHTATRAAEPLPLLARRYDTALPSDRNTRSVELARSMRARVNTDREFVHSVLEMFRTGGFAYSVTPPGLGENSVDDFLFDTRVGFCGHYASAFVALMRAAAIPARVVTGYLGGEWNPIGGYFIVRQSDAHSWAEVWLEGSGWTRVDPTAVVEPERLRRGILDLLPDAGTAPTRLLHTTPWLAALWQRWDAANAWWNARIVRFNYESQLGILERFGFDSPGARELCTAFAAGLLAWLAWVALQLGRTPAGPRPDRLGRAYLRLCRKLARAGLPRLPHQGPLAYAQVVASGRPDLTDPIGGLLHRYANLRYGRDEPMAPLRIARFEREVARLRIRPASRAAPSTGKPRPGRRGP
ncbi:MAG TPA: DUF3488 and transglutaminase-like domain-containing protein [Steroidobacteraceae bacterium]|nr:DUF3488 and transglutaminase-like domain-containing protein [Steroidobacteraceae bacterium]